MFLFIAEVEKQLKSGRLPFADSEYLFAAQRRSAATMSAFYCYLFVGATNLDLLPQ